MPELKTNLLFGAGMLALTHTLTLLPGDLVPAAEAATPGILADEGGEGGEGGGEGGVGTPTSYALNSTDPNRWNYDATAVIDNYIAGASLQYAAAAADAKTLQTAIDVFLANPTDETLAAARQAWVAARPSYLLTEAYRFYDGPIEAVEGEINSWPMNEAYIDYTQEAPQSGLINDPNFTVDEAAITALNQKADEADVTTGWHAIEFLLWGQDLNANGPGARPATDYTPGSVPNDKRRAYLKAVTGKLVNDLSGLVAAWDSKDAKSYAATFKALPPREAIGRIVNGIAVLAGSEFRTERMSVALDSGDQEDEHSCFSDTTHQDFVYDMAGIENAYYGRFGGKDGPGIDDLLKILAPEEAVRIDALMAEAKAKVDALGDPWDQVLASAKDSPQRQAGEAAVKALGDLASALKASGGQLGVLIQIPGM